MFQLGISLVFGLCMVHGVDVRTISISYGNVKPSPTVIDVIEGRSLVMTCSSDDATATLVWSSNDGGIGSFLGANLSIPDVRRSHSGRYFCSLLGGTNTSVLVNVLFPVSRPQISGPTSALEGSGVRLTCSVDGNPAPSYTWVQQGSGVTLATEPVLTERSITDYLHVRCDVRNTMVPTLGEAESSIAKYEVTVKLLREAYVYELYDDYWGEVGSPLEVECKVTTEPEGDVYWTRAQDNWTFRGARMIISSFKADDAGIYTCHTNKTIFQDSGPPIASSAQKSTRIRVFETGNKWKCYNYNSSELRRINGRDFPEGADPHMVVCEDHHGNAYNTGNFLLTPGCTPCKCCQPDKSSPLIQACVDSCAADQLDGTTTPGGVPKPPKECDVSTAGLVAAAAIGWVVVAILTAILLWLWLKARRNSNKHTLASKGAPQTQTNLNNIHGRAPENSNNVHPIRPLPHVPVSERRHSYMEIIEDANTNDSSTGDIRFTEGHTNLPVSETEPGLDNWGYIRPLATENNVDSKTKKDTDKSDYMSLSFKSNDDGYTLGAVRDSEQ